jgi:hypothetical protein
MRLAPLVLAVGASLAGCATTVARLPGEAETPAGPALDACETKSWLVVAPTRSEEVDEVTHRSRPRDDGLGLYAVGSESPQSIPGLEERLGPDPMVLQKAEEVRPHDRKRLIAAGLGGAAAVAMVVGAILFTSAFETERTRQADGTVKEENKIDGTQLGLGVGLALTGFGLGIGGLAVNPNHAERAKADASRYVFHSGRSRVLRLVADHNQRVRQRCGGSGPSPSTATSVEPSTPSPTPPSTAPPAPAPKHVPTDI